MTTRPICYWPAKPLREPTTPITDFGAETVALCQDLCDSMRFYGGIGIAAPQIGISKQVFLISKEIAGTKMVGTDNSIVFINPEIIFTGEEKKKDVEGCLSFPKIFLHIERAIEIKIRAQDLVGTVFEVEARDFLARAIQHEYDHLTGKLMIDFVGQLKRDMIKKKLKKRGKR